MNDPRGERPSVDFKNIINYDIDSWSDDYITFLTDNGFEHISNPTYGALLNVDHCCINNIWILPNIVYVAFYEGVDYSSYEKRGYIYCYKTGADHNLLRMEYGTWNESLNIIRELLITNIKSAR